MFEFDSYHAARDSEWKGQAARFCSGRTAETVWSRVYDPAAACKAALFRRLGKAAAFGLTGSKTRSQTTEGPDRTKGCFGAGG